MLNEPAANCVVVSHCPERRRSVSVDKRTDSAGFSQARSAAIGGDDQIKLSDCIAGCVLQCVAISVDTADCAVESQVDARSDDGRMQHGEQIAAMNAVGNMAARRIGET